MLQIFNPINTNINAFSSCLVSGKCIERRYNTLYWFIFWRQQLLGSRVNELSETTAIPLCTESRKTWVLVLATQMEKNGTNLDRIAFNACSDQKKFPIIFQMLIGRQNCSWTEYAKNPITIQIIKFLSYENLSEGGV